MPRVRAGNLRSEPQRLGGSPFPPPVEVERFRSTLRDRDSPLRIRQSRESGGVWRLLRQPRLDRSSVVRAKRHSPRFSSKQQTEVWRVLFQPASLDFHDALYFELSCSDAVRFIPMQLGTTYRTICQFDDRRSLQLLPTAAPIDFPQSPPFTDARTRSDSLNVGDATDDLEEHAGLIVLRAPESVQSNL